MIPDPSECCDNAITVAIPTLNRPVDALRTVNQLLSHTCNCRVYIHVLDQTQQTSLTSEQLLEIEYLTQVKGVKWAFLSQAGLTQARNVAITEASTSVIVFLDDDVIIPPGYLSCHHATHSRYPYISAIAGPVYHRNPDALHTSLTLENYQSLTTEHFSTRCPNRLQIPWTEILVGCNHSIKKRAAIAVGGYDESIVGGYYEDSDFTLRLRDSNQGPIAFDPNCWIVHLKTPSGGCRVSKNPAHTEAEKLSGFLLYGVRHLRGFQRISFLISTLRVGPLRKEIVIRPSRWLAAITGFCMAFHSAITHRSAVTSPFTNANKTK